MSAQNAIKNFIQNGGWQCFLFTLIATDFSNVHTVAKGAFVTLQEKIKTNKKAPNWVLLNLAETRMSEMG